MRSVVWCCVTEALNRKEKLTVRMRVTEELTLQESTMQRRVTETRAFLNNLPKGPGALCTNAGRLSKPHEEFADKRSAASGPPRSGVTRSVAVQAQRILSVVFIRKS